MTDLDEDQQVGAYTSVSVGGKELHQRERVEDQQAHRALKEALEAYEKEVLPEDREVLPSGEMGILPTAEESTPDIPEDLHRMGMRPAGVGAVPADDDDDQAVVVLPLTEEEIEEGLHRKVYDSFRWLAEWCIRIAKMAHGKVKYAVS